MAQGANPVVLRVALAGGEGFVPLSATPRLFKGSIGFNSTTQIVSVDGGADQQIGQVGVYKIDEVIDLSRISVKSAGPTVVTIIGSTRE